MRFYGDIQKVDEEQRMVWGYASTEAVDAHGEIILKSAIENALEDYMQFANIREMHQLSAVGTAKEAQVDDKGLYLGAKVVDDVAWGKVTSGVYKGYSIGGKVLARDPDDKKTITKILLTEISLVDRPSNPEARFDVYKVAGSPQEDDMAAKKKPAPVKLPKDAKSDVIAKAVNDAVAAGVPVAVASEDEGKLLKAINDKVETVIAGPELPLEKASETAVDAAAETPVVGEGAVAKTDEAQPVADGAAENAETVAKADAAVVVDPIAKATAALDKMDSVLVVDGKLEKSMYHVGRFAEYLEGLSYLAASAEFEAESEGDKSPVPPKMREWVKAGAAIFKELAKEEVDEFVESFKVKKAAAASDLAKAAEPITLSLAIDGKALADSLLKAGGNVLVDSAELANVATERDTLLKTVAEKDEALAKLADRIVSTQDAMLKRNDEMKAEIDDLKKSNTEITAAIDEALAKGVSDGIVEGLKKFGRMPAPSKTAGPLASVSKEQDAGGNGSGNLQKGAALTNEDVAEALGKLSPEERAMAITKAALSMPRQVTYR